MKLITLILAMTLTASAESIPNSFFGPSEYVSLSRKVIQVEVKDNGTLEITYRIPNYIVYATYPAQQEPDSLTKEIYAAKDGKIVLIKTIKGVVIPGRTLPETIEWKESK